LIFRIKSEKFIFCISDELHEKELMEDQAKRIIFDLFPGRFNKSGYDEAEFESILVILRDCINEHMDIVFTSNTSIVRITKLPKWKAWVSSCSI
jgi:hypothetical protein